MKQYLELINEPWGKMFYDIINHQLNLNNSKDLKVLDFGSGFGKTANSFAQFNIVTAIERNEEMVQNRFNNYDYEQIIADEKMLEQLPKNYYDLIICHNVLEYIDDYQKVCRIFSTLIKKDGLISIVKHNLNGTVLHNAILLDNPKKALDIFKSPIVKLS
ncbi:hypothetical protein BW731_02665 [Vagococcus martis]|uniref:Methyltransferase domain-containing protein n=1 Tax=Vagococcus martis TaxID=1768210 RepID=A0A1V4DG59_9ENTE|nr:class I SAM-dependent methyltransferase [Vagococcus martis]OPF87190.1 hypothetical protein BW731_02665 [Vagococcus martis]